MTLGQHTLSATMQFARWTETVTGLLPKHFSSDFLAGRYPDDASSFEEYLELHLGDSVWSYMDDGELTVPTFVFDSNNNLERLLGRLRARKDFWLDCELDGEPYPFDILVVPLASLRGDWRDLPPVSPKHREMMPRSKSEISRRLGSDGARDLLAHRTKQVMRDKKLWRTLAARGRQPKFLWTLAVQWNSCIANWTIELNGAFNKPVTFVFFLSIEPAFPSLELPRDSRHTKRSLGGQQRFSLFPATVVAGDSLMEQVACFGDHSNWTGLSLIQYDKHSAPKIYRNIE
jgi:hypothetical protein